MNGILFTTKGADSLRVSNSGIKYQYSIQADGELKVAYAYGTIKNIYQVLFCDPQNGEPVDLTRVVLEWKWYSPVPCDDSSLILTGKENCVRFEASSPWHKEPFILLSTVHPGNVLFWRSASDKKILHVIDDDIQWA